MRIVVSDFLEFNRSTDLTEINGETLSALGQKQIFAVQNGISALPRIAGHFTS